MSVYNPKGSYPLWYWLQENGAVVDLNKAKKGDKFIITRTGANPKAVTANHDTENFKLYGLEIVDESGEHDIIWAKDEYKAYEVPTGYTGGRRKTRKSRRSKRKSRRN